MQIVARLILFFASLMVLGAIYIGQQSYLSSIPQSTVIIVFTSLAAASFALLLVEHWFTSPTHSITNSLSTLLVMLPAYPSLSQLGVWYYILLGYSALILALSCLALGLLGFAARGNDAAASWSNSLKSIVSRFGRARVLYPMVALASLLAYFDSQSISFLLLTLFAMAVVAFDPRSMLPSLIETSSSKSSLVGDVIGVQSRHTFLAKLRQVRQPLNLYDFVEFRVGDDKSTTRKGIIIDNWVLNSEQWIKILSGKDVNASLGRSRINKKVKRNAVHKIETDDTAHLLDRFVGTVAEGSEILSLRFVYARKQPISEGTLLEVSVDGKSVLYQVTQGVTKVEILESKNQAGLVIGTAAQVGIWNEQTLTFDRFGWVPEINWPVYLAPQIEEQPLPAGETLLGHVPDTNYPILMDKKAAINTHLAVLGVTGTGKSVFSRKLIREFAADGMKIICVDFTGEYRDKLADSNPVQLVSGQEAEGIFTNVDNVGNMMAQFPNNRDMGLIAQWEGEIRAAFRNVIEGFRDHQTNVALFELPDVSNTNAILSYTRYFFKVLFEMAKQDELGQLQFGVVLEEAHTVVPEWNFVASEDKSAGALVNQIGQIALQGRKYGVGFLVIAQRTANVSKTVLTQCNTVVAFQQFDKTSADFLANYMGSGMIEALQNLPPRHAIAVGKAFRSGLPTIFRVPHIAEPN